MVDFGYKKAISIWLQIIRTWNNLNFIYFEYLSVQGTLLAMEVRTSTEKLYRYSVGYQYMILLEYDFLMIFHCIVGDLFLFIKNFMAESKISIAVVFIHSKHSKKSISLLWGFQISPHPIDHGLRGWRCSRGFIRGLRWSWTLTRWETWEGEP